MRPFLVRGSLVSLPKTIEIMSLKIDRVQLQFEIKPDYDQQQLQKLEDDLQDYVVDAAR